MRGRRALHRLIGEIDFGEGPRWRDDRLWYSDFHQHAVYSVGADGARRTEVADLDDRPSGLGWLPDGTMLVVGMTRHQVLRVVDGVPTLHADLAPLANGCCNDMVVDATGNAYVGTFGFDLDAGEPFALAEIILVRPDGSAAVAADGMHFPNGAVITPAGDQLIVGETFGGQYLAFPIEHHGTLGERRVWAPVPGMAPDGCTLDVDGAIWFADAMGNQVVRVKEGGEIDEVISTPMPAFACMLGGADGTTLFVLCAPGSAPADVGGRGLGQIFTVEVDRPHAGRP